MRDESAEKSSVPFAALSVVTAILPSPASFRVAPLSRIVVLDVFAELQSNVTPVAVVTVAVP